MKNTVTPPGIDPGTVRLVAQCLNHYATPGPLTCNVAVQISTTSRCLLQYLPISHIMRISTEKTPQIPSYLGFLVVLGLE